MTGVYEYKYHNAHNHGSRNVVRTWRNVHTPELDYYLGADFIAKLAALA